ncbi:LuxR family two component transcriptional regulator [Oryzihumus leptocrescens]|uniref:LuxR family two component transcriptional regulator n=2 Tax=Oryzihumus leptocrescens TaxID=297536 RepID=A0A542ZI21_9MICO|nr:LuxR family two component transcriptional regulator [Oryzihumus leptocrescens]
MERRADAKGSAMTVKVFLLDDHEIVRRGIRELLEMESDIEVVGESGSAQEATRRIPALRPQVALLDARLPDGSGLDVCRDVRSVDPSIQGLILTSFNDEDALATAILAGAAGYLLKDIKGQDLVQAIRRVAAGEKLIDPAVAQRVKRSWEEDRGADPRLRTLTPQERRILEHVAEGLTNRQIGEAMFLAEKTVKNYITAVLAKLGMERRTQAAVFAATHLGAEEEGQAHRAPRRHP